MTLLNDKQWNQLSTREIAKLSNVSHQLVHNLRNRQESHKQHLNNSQSLSNYDNDTELSLKNKIIYPEDVIKFLDDFDDDDDDKPTNHNQNNNSTEITQKFPITPLFPSDIKPLGKDTFSIICDRYTINKLNDFIKAEGIITAEGAISRLLDIFDNLPK